MKPRHDARLVPTALAAYGATLAVLVGDVSLHLCLGILTALALLGLCLRVRALQWWCAGGAAAVFCVVAHVAEESRWHGGLHEVAVTREILTVNGVVVTEPRVVREGVSAVTVSMEAFCSREVSAQVASRADTGEQHCIWHRSQAQAVLVGDMEGVRYGDRLHAHGAAALASGGREAIVLWNAGIDAREEGPWYRRWAAEVRANFREASRWLPERTRGLVTGMTIGDTSQMDPVQREDMRRTSLAHLTAVSGAHFSVAMLAISALLRMVRVPRGVRAVALVMMTIVFAAVVLPTPSVMRAGFMGLVVAAALWWGRRGQPLPALSAAVVTLIGADPFLAMSYGFALSVSATAAIALWSPFLAHALERIMVPRVARLLSIPLAAQLATFPVLVLMEPRLALYGVFANLVAVPSAVVVIVAGITGVVLAGVHPWLAAPALGVASLAAEVVAFVARTFAALPGATVPWPSGTSGFLLALIVLVTSIVASTALRLRAYVRGVVLLVVMAVVAASPPIKSAWIETTIIPRNWVISMCDVGQGDMTLVRAGTSSAVVIDTGEDPVDAAECLRRHGVREVALLVLSHPHHDHDGGVQGVVTEASVRRAWVPALALNDEFDSATQLLRNAGVEVTRPDSRVTIQVGNAEVRAWAGPTGGHAHDSTDVNDASIALYVKVDSLAILFTGDLERAGQAALLAQRDIPLQADIIKVPHHGSATRDPLLAATVAPVIALVGVGHDNRFGHPSSAALDDYRAVGAQVFTTASCGTISIVAGPPPSVHARCTENMAGLDHGTTDENRTVVSCRACASRADFRTRRTLFHSRGGSGGRCCHDRTQHPHSCAYRCRNC